MKKKLLTPNNLYIAIILLLILIIISCYKCKEYFTEHYDNTEQLTLILYINVDIFDLIKFQNAYRTIQILDKVRDYYNEYVNSNSLNLPFVKYDQQEFNTTYTTPTFVLLKDTSILETYIPTSNHTKDINNLVELIKKYNIQKPTLTLINVNNNTSNNYNDIFNEIQKKYKKYVDTHTKGNKIMNITYEIRYTSSDISEQPYFVFTNTNGTQTDIKPTGDKKADQVLDYLKKNTIYIITNYT